MKLDFFKNIDTEEKAYWLGFFSADGYINKRGNTSGVCLAIKDKEHLIKFQKSLDGLGTLFFRKGRYSTNHPETEKVVLEVYYKSFCEDLMNLGLTVDKSYTLKPTVIANNLKNHYIRGIFDGDGSIFESNNVIGLHISGTKEILEYIRKEINISVRNNIYYDKRTVNSHALKYANKTQLQVIYDYLYKDSTVFLERKYEKFKKLLKGLETIPTGSTL